MKIRLDWVVWDPPITNLAVHWTRRDKKRHFRHKFLRHIFSQSCSFFPFFHYSHEKREISYSVNTVENTLTIVEGFSNNEKTKPEAFLDCNAFQWRTLYSLAKERSLKGTKLRPTFWKAKTPTTNTNANVNVCDWWKVSSHMNMQKSWKIAH